MNNNINDIFQWHRWFAIFPVITEDRHLVWLSSVERKRSFKCAGSGFNQIKMIWEYRKI